jgi:butyryl-CoA dehydrogenase
MGVHAISQGLQCLGGSGYCDDYPLEQYYRDSRIHPIHEGTTGIQGMDLLGRKVIMQNGQAFLLYINELQDTITAAKEYKDLEKYAGELNESLVQLEEVSQHLLSIAQQQGPEAFLADATLYLEFFGIVTIAWQWLLQGIAAQKALKNDARKKDLNFYEGKMFTLRYFFGYELPKTLGLAKRLMDDDRLTVEMQADYFND